MKERSTPQNVEAERIVLGALLFDPSRVAPDVLEAIQADDFYDSRHRYIFRAVTALFSEGKIGDITVIANYLGETGKLDAAGGRLYLSELLDSVVTLTSLEHYTEIVRKKSILRAIISAGGQITEIGYDEELDPGEALDKAESTIFSISTSRSSETAISMAEYVGTRVEALEVIHHNPDQHAVTGIETGFPYLDELTAGLQKTDLILIAGRPSTGKSSLATAIARFTALHKNKKVAIFSLEMNKDQVVDRMIAAEGRINLHHMRAGKLSSEKFRDATRAAAKISNSTVIVDDSPGISVLEIRARTRRLVAKHKDLDLIIIDYVQLIDAGIKAGSREQEVSYISRSIKKLAGELQVPVILISQLNRAVERRETRRPILSDLRESGALEQDADVVLFIYREEQETTSNTVESEIIIAKQRNGPLGQVKVLFNKASSSFYPLDITSEREEAPPF